MDHPAGEDERELAQVFAFGGRWLRSSSTDSTKLDPVAGGAAQRLAHVGEQGDGAGSGGFGGGHHEGGQILGVFRLRRNAPEPVFTSRTSALRPAASFLLKMDAQMRPGLSTVPVRSRRA
jgi:hypothetical protein